MEHELSINDYFTSLAKEQGYPARSVYKLGEIDKKFRLLKKRDRVLDLGSCPGSWLLYLSRRLGQNGKVVGVDEKDLKINLPTNTVFIKKDVFSSDFFEVLGNEKFNAVVSDLAPKTTGVKDRDIALSLEIAEKSFEIAGQVLEQGGNFICKIFEGEGNEELFKKIKSSFEFTKKFRPQAVKKGSREIYIVAKIFLAR